MIAIYFEPRTAIGKIFIVNTDSDFNDKVSPGMKSIWKTLIDYETIRLKVNHISE